MIIIKSQWRYGEPEQLIDATVIYREGKEQHVILCSDTNNIVRQLGSYKDVQRSKEVMDMIEKHIEWLILLRNSTEAADAYGGESSFIFTMPKE